MAMISMGVASIRIISMPNIGMTEMTIIESRTVCMVTAAEMRSSFVLRVACAPWIRQVCQTGSAGSTGCELTTFFFAPQLLNSTTAQHKTGIIIL